MNYLEINRLMYETLETFAPIATSRVSMFALNDPYACPPSFRFRFKDKSKDDEIYNKIKHIVESYEGFLKWKLVAGTSTDNYLITTCFIDADSEGTVFRKKKEYYISILGKDIYYEKIEKAIKDIPKLAEMIKVSMKLADKG